MARNWCSDLNEEIGELIPGAHANYDYSAFDVDYVGAKMRSVSAANGDWRQYFKHHSRNFSNINLILQPNTEESEAERLFSEMEDIMSKYRIKTVTFVCPVDEESYNTIIETEQAYNNSYSVPYDEAIKWHEAISR